MGLGKEWAQPSTRWDATNFSNLCINACWELYGAKDLAHLPSSGSTYELTITRPPAATFPWVLDHQTRHSPTLRPISDAHFSSPPTFRRLRTLTKFLMS